MLLCPVRDCHLALERGDGRVFCPRGHSFDIARSGYINLLQPQDRRSKNPGDSAAAVAARRRLHDLGVTAPLLNAIVETSAQARAVVRDSETNAQPGAVARDSEKVLDAGCGDGFYLGELARLTGCEAHGVDISIPAIQAAARRYPQQEWIVANADRFIPYADQSFSLVISITARMNSAEFRRVLKPDGRLLVALAAPDDLIEIRGNTQRDPGRDRVDRTLETFASHFTLVDRRRVTTTADLDAASVEDVLLSIYRPLRSRPVSAMRVTFSLDLLLLHPRRCGDQDETIAK
jgi:23S rRNA (guanine745-N1)-methyltransferase